MRKWLKKYKDLTKDLSAVLPPSTTPAPGAAKSLFTSLGGEGRTPELLQGKTAQQGSGQRQGTGSMQRARRTGMGGCREFREP